VWTAVETMNRIFEDSMLWSLQSFEMQNAKDSADWFFSEPLDSNNDY
jgi:hypothetical protein